MRSRKRPVRFPDWVPGPHPAPGPDEEREDEGRDLLPPAVLSVTYDPELVPLLEARAQASSVVGGAGHWKASTFRQSDPLRFELHIDGLMPFQRFELKLAPARTASGPAQGTDPVLIAGVAEGNGSWTGKWRYPPKGLLGHYRVSVKDVSPPSFIGAPKIVLPALGTRPAGQFSYAIVPDPEARPAAQPDLERTFFGLEHDFALEGTRPVGIHLFPWLGVRWVRAMDYRWNRHPNPDLDAKVAWDGELDNAGTQGAPQRYYWWMDPAYGTGPGRWSGTGPPSSAWEIRSIPALLNLNMGNLGVMNDLWPAAAGPGAPDTYGEDGSAAALGGSDGPEAWADYCYHAARKFSSEEPGATARLYQVPAFELYPWDVYKGALIDDVDNDAQVNLARRVALKGLAQIYGIAHEQIRWGEVTTSLTSRALLLGPMSPSIRLQSDLGISRWDAEQPDNWFTSPANRNSPWFNPKDVMQQPVLGLDAKLLPGEPRIVDVLDGFSTHPYVFKGNKLPVWSDAGSWQNLDLAEMDAILVEGIREIRQGLDDLGRPDMPIYATEFGFTTSSGNADESAAVARGRWPLDREQALGLIRSNLILLGEGVRAGVSFASRDFPTNREPEVGAWQYGLYYNLAPGFFDPATSADEVLSPTALAPRPSAPAYAAMTSLLEGFAAVPAWTKRLAELLGQSASGSRGYVYQRGVEVIFALWRPAGAGAALTLADLLDEFGLGTVVPNELTLYDWMGNSMQVASTDSLTLTEEPVYVTGAEVGDDHHRAVDRDLRRRSGGPVPVGRRVSAGR